MYVLFWFFQFRNTKASNLNILYLGFIWNFLKPYKNQFMFQNIILKYN